MSSSFPLANHTFTVNRRIPGVSTATMMVSGLSVLIDMKNGWVDTSKGGQMVTGIYEGTCSKNAGVLVKDILVDENDLNVRDEAISYEIVDCFVDALFTNLILRRTDS
jgi:hypothetical protein